MDIQLTTNPVEVLRTLRPTAATRPPWTAWVAAIRQEGPETVTTARTISTLAAICRRVDALAAGASIVDVSLSAALEKDMFGIGTGPGALAAELDKSSVETLSNQIERWYSPFFISDLDRLTADAEHLSRLLNAVTDRAAPVAQVALAATETLLIDLRFARERGVLFVDPVLFTERRHSMVVYGLTLQREGAAREAQFIFSIVLTLAGLIPVVSIPATLASLGIALAERAGEQELAALRAANASEDEAGNERD